MRVVRTYLELPTSDALRAAPVPAAVTSPVRIERLASPGAAECRARDPALGGADPGRDRLAWSAARLADYLARPEVSVWVLRVGDETAGYFELLDDTARDGGVEIVYFGLIARFHGRGLGRYMLTRAVEEAWRTPHARRVWLHTCTLDGPAALPNYLGRGFRIVRSEEYEVEGLGP